MKTCAILGGITAGAILAEPGYSLVAQPGTCPERSVLKHDPLRFECMKAPGLKAYLAHVGDVCGKKRVDSSGVEAQVFAFKKFEAPTHVSHRLAYANACPQQMCKVNVIHASQSSETGFLNLRSEAVERFITACERGQEPEGDVKDQLIQTLSTKLQNDLDRLYGKGHCQVDSHRAVTLSRSNVDSKGDSATPYHIFHRDPFNQGESLPQNPDYQYSKRYTFWIALEDVQAWPLVIIKPNSVKAVDIEDTVFINYDPDQVYQVIPQMHKGDTIFFASSDCWHGSVNVPEWTEKRSSYEVHFLVAERKANDSHT
jgi:hypothetical protein